MSDHGLRVLFAANETIFVEGEPGERAFLIERGQIDISFEREGKPIRIASLGAGEIFGEMALIDDRPRSATARAVAETEAIVIRRDQIQLVLKGADPTLALLLRVLLGRFRSMQGLLDATADIAPAVSDPMTIASDHDVAAIDRLRMEQEIAQAMQRDEFDLLLQPIVSLNDGGVAGFETLLRWRHPQRGLVPPNLMVQLAESSALITELDAWVFGAALTRIRKLHARFAVDDERPPPFVTINLSGMSFAQDPIPAARGFLDMIDASGVPPGLVKIEITEGALIKNPKDVSVALEALRGAGVHIALDDFGTGYSSLSYLVGFPITTLKIDRMFVQDMLKDQRSLEVVRAVISLAHALNLETIAEGVETTAQLQALWRMQCGYGQGYLLGRPMGQEQAGRLAEQSAVITRGPVLLED